MEQLVFIEKGQVVTDSLTVSEVFQKEHKHVVRDIEVQVQKLIEAGEREFSQSNFGLSDYRNTRGKKYKKYDLSEDAFALIAMSYVSPEAMKFKIRFMNEFKRLKEALRVAQIPSYTIEDPIVRAERWIEEQKEKRMLEQRVAEFEPKLSYLDQILQSKSTVTITQIAKDYDLTGQELNKVLHDDGVQYKLNGQWLLYSKHHGKGFTKSNTVDIQHNDGSRSVKMNTRWTQKGRLFIHEILQKRNILPVVDRELTS